jgi:hypothetical protein
LVQGAAPRNADILRPAGRDDGGLGIERLVVVDLVLGENSLEPVSQQFSLGQDRCRLAPQNL